MERENQESLSKDCSSCNKSFRDKYTLKQHLKKFHTEEITQNESSNQSHIKCPLYLDDQQVSCKTHSILIRHLIGVHNIRVEQKEIKFNSKEEFQKWRELTKNDIKYVMMRSVKNRERTKLYYDCNRNNSSGYKSKCSQRLQKLGGSMKSKGTCPSRYEASIYQDFIHVLITETHIGHDEELRYQRLTKLEKQEIIKKLEAGVSDYRILKEARKITTSTIERINLLNMDDIKNLKSKINLKKRRNPDDMVAVAMKVEEWNSTGEMNAFLFKKEGDEHPILKKSDFALGYMNSTMESKLRNFNKIICMDGTHGTNIKKFELTVMLVKDENSAGFPVAFLLSNRLDQAIQEIFLEALKKRLGEEIKPNYFMSDDDGKYYNAWVNKMGNSPRRLLCTWHVVKNWHIQGRSKLQDPNMKTTMKADLYKILTSTTFVDFVKSKEDYFDKLEKNKEMPFLNYLRRYYFQNEERIRMWAYCYRHDAGINTNMISESFNKVLKYQFLGASTRTTVEQLLDTLEEIVDEKMWKTIVNMERPRVNNYQNKEINRAHQRAEEINFNNLEVISFGEFKVKSSSGNDFYQITYGNLSDCKCMTVICKVCEICRHHYKCTCLDYVIKNNICKHVHLVALYERRVRGSSVLVQEVVNDTRSKINEAANNFIQEKQCEQIEITPDVKIKIIQEDVMEKVKRVDLDVLMKLQKILDNEIKQDLPKKRKIEKQSYFPNKKKKE